ncbi:MAG: tRNA (adenosine(37)-N6)-dimethylallyltransferase MiaA [Sedimentisphaerales bacterium]
MKNQRILILGVTASGKGKLAFELANRLNGEIVSVDSMKVYRRLNIGTAKPPVEKRRQIPYHLIDVVEPSDSFSVAGFLELAEAAVKDILSRNKPVVAVGGTALYIKSMLYGLFEGPGADEKIREELKEQVKAEGLAQLYAQLQKIDPEAASRISANDQRRIIRALEVYRLTGKPISSFQSQWKQTSNCLTAEHAKPLAESRLSEDENAEKKIIKNNLGGLCGLRGGWTLIGLRREKTEENKRINARAKMMIDAGLVDEVKGLLAEGKPLSNQARCAIGYAEIIEYLAGKTTLDDAIESIKKNTRKFAKQQRTWFKTFKNVCWLDLTPDESVESVLDRAKEILKIT